MKRKSLFFTSCSEAIFFLRKVANKMVADKIELLSKPTWSVQEIMNWCEVSRSTAYKIKDRAVKEFDGAIKYGTERVKTDSVLAL